MEVALHFGEAVGGAHVEEGRGDGVGEEETGGGPEGEAFGFEGDGAARGDGFEEGAGEEVDAGVDVGGAADGGFFAESEDAAVGGEVEGAVAGCVGDRGCPEVGGEFIRQFLTISDNFRKRRENQVGGQCVAVEGEEGGGVGEDGEEVAEGAAGAQGGGFAGEGPSPKQNRNIKNAAPWI